MDMAVPSLGKLGEEVVGIVKIERYGGKLLEWKINMIGEKGEGSFVPSVGNFIKISGIEADRSNISRYVMRTLEECHGR